MNNVVELGGQDFTIDCWCYMLSSSGWSAPIFQLVTNLSSLSNGIILWRYAGNNFITFDFCNIPSGKIPVSFNTLYHYALVYNHDDKLLSLYINGKFSSQKSGIQLARTCYPYLVLGWRLNNSGVNGWFNGYIDEFRIVDGVAVWNEDFTPPTEPYRID